MMKYVETLEELTGQNWPLPETQEEASERLMSKQRVLVVDDDDSVREMLSDYFGKSGFEVTCAADGVQALTAAQEFHPDLVVLDIMLPEMDGLEVLKEVRRMGSVPVIALTARAEEVDRILGLEMGADDYVTKPFSPRELLARTKAVLRRAALSPAAEETQVLSLPGLTVSRVSREVKMGDARIELTPKEFDLLWHFACNRNRVFTREQLLEQVWAYQEFYGDERTVDQHVKRLRRKIQIDGSPCRITTIWGVGYKFEIRDHGVPV